MLVHVLSAFVFFVFAAMLFNFIINRRGRQNARTLDRYLAAERTANLARKKTIAPEYFYIPDMRGYPISDAAGPDDADVAKKQAAVLKQSKLKMLNFSPPKSNLDIKTEFGYANLELIAGYEENWHRFFTALIDWAEALLHAGRLTEAEKILENAVNDGCDLTKAFIILADVYYNKKDKANLNALLLAAQNLASFQQNKIRGYAETKISNL